MQITKINRIANKLKYLDFNCEEFEVMYTFEKLSKVPLFGLHTICIILQINGYTSTLLIAPIWPLRKFGPRARKYFISFLN